jgi:hypothetical protein
MKIKIKASEVLVGDHVKVGIGSPAYRKVSHSYPLNIPGNWMLLFGGSGHSLALSRDEFVTVLRDETPDAETDRKALDEIAAIVREWNVSGKVRRVREVVDRVRPEPPKLDPDTVLVDVDAHGQIVAIVEDEVAAPDVHTYRIPLATLRAVRGDGRHLWWRLPEMPPSELTRLGDTWERS